MGVLQVSSHLEVTRTTRMTTLRTLKRQLENFSPALVLTNSEEMDAHGPDTRYDIKHTSLLHPP